MHPLLCVFLRTDVPTVEDEPLTVTEEKQDENQTTENSCIQEEKVDEGDMKIEEVENETVEDSEAKENKDEGIDSSVDEESEPISETLPESDPVQQSKPEITDESSQGFLFNHTLFYSLSFIL